MISGSTIFSVAISAMKKGAYDYLLKPVDKEQLLTTVRRALKESRAGRTTSTSQERQNLERLVEARTEMLRPRDLRP